MREVAKKNGNIGISYSLTDNDNGCITFYLGLGKCNFNKLVEGYGGMITSWILLNSFSLRENLWSLDD